MSNSIEVRKALSKICNGKHGHCSRPEGGYHVLCNGRVARMAAIFPVKLCKPILSGFSRQLRKDGLITDGVVGMHECEHGRNREAKVDDGSVMSVQSVEMHGHILKFDDGEGPFYDDLTKQQLPSSITLRVRMFGVEFLCRSPIELTAACQ